MNHAVFNIHFGKLGPRHFLVWLLLVVTGLLALVAVERTAQIGKLNNEGSELHRLVSQRAGQHDAHLTALSAIAKNNLGESSELFLEVARAISQFYPRVDEVQLVQMDPTLDVVGTVKLTPSSAQVIRETASQPASISKLLHHPDQPEHYFLVKRVPKNGKPVFALALGINAKELIRSQKGYWSKENVSVQLSMPDGTSLGSSPDAGATQYSTPLDTESQPLLLESGIQFRILELLNPARAAAVILLISIAYLAFLAVRVQRAGLHAAQYEAELRRTETRLAHASRVNAMGELASGMAHELTQPMTAILAQAQVSRRLLAREDYKPLASSLDDVIDQTKRASSILERLRNWSRPQRGMPVEVDLSDILKNVRALLASEIDRLEVKFVVDVPDHPVVVRVDQVEIEQVVHNVIRNALEALDGQLDGEINVRMKKVSGKAILNITDNGPGIPEELRPQLFTPFYTTREHGTGLGLALCQRLIERAGGEIFFVPGSAGASFRIVLQLAATMSEAAE